jgi:glycerophosphoryl diester phosphodiesterase
VDSTPTHRPLLLGHRGCRGPHPENTFVAFEYALASGCQGFEFDVRATADDYLVLIHDRKDEGNEVAHFTYAGLNERRRRPRADSPSDPIAYLDEMLERFACRAWLDIELKVTGIEQRVLSVLRKHPPKLGYVVSSFLPGVIRNVHSLDATIPLGLIFKYKSEMAMWKDLPLTHLMPHHRMVSDALVNTFHRAGKRVVTWTVNDEHEMQRVAAAGVDAIISDDPVLLSRTFSGI